MKAERDSAGLPIVIDAPALLHSAIHVDPADGVWRLQLLLDNRDERDVGAVMALLRRLEIDTLQVVP